MENADNIHISVLSEIDKSEYIYDFDKAIFDIDTQIDFLNSKADVLDYIVSAASGLLCGALDVLWVGEFNLGRGREFASEEVNKFVEKTAKLLGCKDGDTKDCVKFLEDKFPIPADGNTTDFGGGLQHHLRDFAHHPTIAGLAFSLLTQFTGKAYGTDKNGLFIIVDVPDKSKIFIGQNTITKIINGTVIWFFHLVSDIAGSSNTAGLSGGTGIPGPILSLAKEMSTLPLFRNMSVNDSTLSVFLSKLFNGTLLAEHDENGKIIPNTVLKLDFRGELGAIAEIGRQTLPVMANECFVRLFYFIRRLAIELKENDISAIHEIRSIDWKKVVPANSPTLTRMLTVATGVFSTIDIADAVITQKYWVSINYVGICRFAVAIGGEIAWNLKRQDLQAIRQIYERIKKNTFVAEDNSAYGRIETDMDADRLGLTLEETEILYNIEYQKTKNDITATKLLIGKEKIAALKQEWLDEWASYMANGFDEFVHVPGAVLHWYSLEELNAKIQSMSPTGTWYKLVILEAMLFEPYFTLSTEVNKRGKEVPSKKYNSLRAPLIGCNESIGDKYIEDSFSKLYCPIGFVYRLRKCHSKVLKELNEVLKTAITAISIGAGAVILIVVTAGAFAPQIAVLLVGSEFTGLSGAALTSACLAYLGGGAIAAGGLGMAGGTVAIVGGGAVLGLGAGAAVGGITAAVGLNGKEATIMQSAKLLVSVREIFLNEEKDIAYSTAVYEQYVASIAEIEKGIVDLRLKANVASKEEKKQLKAKIKNAEESANAMKIAMKSMNKFIGAYKVGLGLAQ